MNIRFGFDGSCRIVCRHRPPAPGAHDEPGAVAAQAGQLLPVLPAVGRVEQRGVLDARVDRRRDSVSDGSRCHTRLNSHG